MPSIDCTKLSLDEEYIPIAAFLGASIRFKKEERKLMEEFLHVKLNDAYGEVLVEPPKGKGEATARFGNCTDAYTIMALSKAR